MDVELGYAKDTVELAFIGRLRLWAELYAWKCFFVNCIITLKRKAMAMVLHPSRPSSNNLYWPLLPEDEERAIDCSSLGYVLIDPRLKTRLSGHTKCCKQIHLQGWHHSKSRVIEPCRLWYYAVLQICSTKRKGVPQLMLLFHKVKEKQDSDSGGTSRISCRVCNWHSPTMILLNLGL